ncbi:hypothetical protein [Haloglomus litoreum]|uniref:hypothetical protein n=1 Tax=Haloglomus litoreum TaxID=3034026 RepID=UPI0023E87A80|nr:hypothetical protein [Haloglomus sp. DT116]
MTKPPHLYRDPEPEARDDLLLEIAVGNSRRRLELSDRVVSLLVDDLGYEQPDVVPFLLAKAFVLAGGATLPERGGDDERDLAWRLGGADGGRRPSSADLERTATYLESVEVPDRSLEPLRELVRSSRLADVCDPEDIRDRSERVNRLRDIARDL